MASDGNPVLLCRQVQMLRGLPSRKNRSQRNSPDGHRLSRKKRNILGSASVHDEHLHQPKDRRERRKVKGQEIKITPTHSFERKASRKT